MKSYVLFGAGANAANAVRIIGKDKVAFIVDNDKSKMGTDISEIPVYYFPEKEKDCASYQIVITTSEKFYYEISMQLEDCRNSFIYIFKLYSDAENKRKNTE